MFTYKSTYVSIKCYELLVMANPIYFFYQIGERHIYVYVVSTLLFWKRTRESADRSDSN